MICSGAGRGDPPPPPNQTIYLAEIHTQMHVHSTLRPRIADGRGRCEVVASGMWLWLL